MPRFMGIERFKSGQSGPVYARYHEKGRMLPEGLRYIDSWLSAGDDVCYQLMETQRPVTFDSWIANWDDLVNFEVIKLKEKPTGRQK